MFFCKLINWYLIFDITLCNCDLWSVTAMIHTEGVDTLPWESLTLFLRSLTLFLRLLMILLEWLTFTNCHPSFVIAFNVLTYWNLKSEINHWKPNQKIGTVICYLLFNAHRTVPLCSLKEALRMQYLQGFFVCYQFNSFSMSMNSSVSRNGDRASPVFMFGS